MAGEIWEGYEIDRGVCGGYLEGVLIYLRCLLRRRSGRGMGFKLVGCDMFLLVGEDTRGEGWG